MNGARSPKGLEGFLRRRGGDSGKSGVTGAVGVMFSLLLVGTPTSAKTNLVGEEGKDRETRRRRPRLLGFKNSGLSAIPRAIVATKVIYTSVPNR